MSVGETILRRCAADLLVRNKKRHLGEIGRSRSTADSHFVTLNRLARREQILKGEIEEEEGMSEIPGTTSSMQYVEFHGDVFNLEIWLGPGDLTGIIPVNFSAPPTARGVLMTDSISTQLGALHKCLHMHVILGQSESFSKTYRGLRLPIINSFFKQADRSFKQKTSLTTVLPVLLASVTGFFLFERIFQHCAVYKEGPFSNTELNALWDEFCSKLDIFLSRSLIGLTSPEEMLVVKEELLLFIETTNDAIFQAKDVVQSSDSNKIYIVMSKCWDSFEVLQVDSAMERCKLELDGCLYQSLYVDTEARYSSLIKAFHIETLMYDEGRGNTSGLGSTATTSLSGTATNTTNNPKNENTSIFRVHSDVKSTSSVPVSASSVVAVRRSHGSMGAAAAALDALEEGMDIGIGTSSPHSLSPSTLQGTTFTDTQSMERGEDKDRSGGEDSQREDQRKAFVPVTFPFSSAIPGIIKQMHLLILRFFVFSARNPHLNSKGEALCTSVMKVFRYLNSIFKEELERGGDGTPLSKACQV